MVKYFIFSDRPRHFQMNQKQAFTPRKGKNDAPIGWTPTKLRGKPEWRCKEIQFNLKYNELRRCSYCCEKRLISRHKDKHVFTIPQCEDDEFPKEILEKQDLITHNRFNKRFLEHLALFCGRLDISFSKSATKAMREFCLYLLKEGYNMARNFPNDTFNINKMLDPISEQKVADSMIQVAENEFDNKIQKFQKKSYCVLLCDAGTVLKLHCLHFVIALYDDPINIMLFDTFDGEEFNSEFYSNCFQKVIEKALSLNIHICSITTDNLRAQINGWNTYITTTDSPYLQAMYRVPCFDHMINLVFKDIIKRSELFSKAINKTLQILKEIRKPECVEFIGSKCPTYSPTRWLYIVDILLFILNKRNDISSFIEIGNILNDTTDSIIGSDIEFLYKVLILFKIYSLIVEKKDFQIFNIVPLSRELITCLRKLYDDTDNNQYKEAIDIVDASFRARIICNGYNETITAYALSSYGRAELRKKYENVMTQNISALSFTTPIEKIQQNKVDFEKKRPPIYFDEIGDDDDYHYTEESMKDADELIKETEEEEEDEELLNEYKSLQELPYDKRNSDNLYRNVYKTALKQLNEVGSLLDIPEEYIERKFNEFLFADPINLDFMKHSHEPPYKFWRRVYCFDEDWEVFADLALRFSSSFSSEAIVERFLSIQKFIQEDRMTNVSSEVMKARMQLHDLSKPNDSA